MTNDDRCQRCHDSMEDVLHAMCDCPQAKQVWYELGDRHFIHLFFSFPFDKWFEWNLRENLSNHCIIRWNAIFSKVARILWKTCNEVFFATGSGSLTGSMII